MERRLAAIFALDMVGYSRLMEADEADTLERQESLRAELIDPVITQHNGRIVKGTGDGLPYSARRVRVPVLRLAALV